MKKLFLLSLVFVCLFSAFFCEAKTEKKNKKDKKIEERANKKDKKKTEKKSDKKSKKTDKKNKNTAVLGKPADFRQAQQMARINKCPILLVFSGSDWCGWCVKLDKEVFATPVFKKWASENVIFYVADFPRRKVQPADLKRQNQELQVKYNVSGFPTVFLLKHDGSVIKKTGYIKGGPQKYIRHLKMFMGAAR